MEGKKGNFGLVFNENKSKAELIGFKYKDYTSNLVLTKNSKTKAWANGSISLNTANGAYDLSDKKISIAKAKQK